MKLSIKSRFKQIKQWIVDNQSDIILVIGVILISLLSFAMGFIAAKQQEKTPLKIEFYEDSNNWSGNNGTISGLEIG